MTANAIITADKPSVDPAAIPSPVNGALVPPIEAPDPVAEANGGTKVALKPLGYGAVLLTRQELAVLGWVPPTGAQRESTRNVTTALNNQPYCDP